MTIAALSTIPMNAGTYAVCSLSGSEAMIFRTNQCQGFWVPAFAGATKASAAAFAAPQSLTASKRLPGQASPMGTLRFILALSVAFSHFGLPFGVLTSDTAVQSFFVISGFYMALVLNEKYGAGTYWLFISNRLLRLLPAYFVVLVFSLAAASNWRPILALDPLACGYFIVSQLLIVGQELYVFLLVNHGTLVWTLHPAGIPKLLYTFSPIPQAWTLALEMYFYLLAPFLVRRGPVVIAAIIAVSLVLRMSLQGAFGFSGDPWSFRFFPSEIALFLTGSLGYYAYAAAEAAQRSRLKALLSVIAVLLFVCLAINRWDGVPRLLSLSVLAVVIVAVPRLFELTRNIAWDKYIGELSYPLYICHFLFGWWLEPDSTFGAACALCLSVAASILLYHLIDRPVDRWRQGRFTRTQRAEGEGRLLQAV
jgi:peptidoglycan/LPS O-acetylase OafA/YrhL